MAAFVCVRHTNQYVVYSASAIITPAEGIYQRQYGVNGELSAMVLSMYVLGYGLGPLLFSPMSELPMIGRNVPYMFSFGIFIIMTAIGSGVSNFAGIVVIRVSINDFQAQSSSITPNS